METSRRTNNLGAFPRVCSSETNSVSWLSLSAGYWSDLRAHPGTLFFPDKIQTKHSQTQLHKEESSFFVKGMMVAPCRQLGVSDDLDQEVQWVRGFWKTLRGTDACSFCNSQRSSHSRPNCDGTTQSDTLSESALVQDVRRIPRTTVENRRREPSTRRWCPTPRK